MNGRNLLLQVNIRIEFFGTFNTQAVAEFRIRMVPDKRFQLMPVASVITYSFTSGTNWNYPFERFDFLQELFHKIMYQNCHNNSYAYGKKRRKEIFHGKREKCENSKVLQGNKKYRDSVKKRPHVKKQY